MRTDASDVQPTRESRAVSPGDRGYGLFGTIATVTLRLAQRQKIQRVVDVRDIDDLPAAFERRIADGFIYGDFQFAIDEKSDDFLRRGVFSCYKPVAASTPVSQGQQELVDDDWRYLLLAAHASKAEAFERYSKLPLNQWPGLRVRHASTQHLLAACLLLSAVLMSSVGGAVRRALLVVVWLQFVAYLVWMLGHDDFLYVIIECGSAMLVVFFWQFFNPTARQTPARMDCRRRVCNAGRGGCSAKRVGRAPAL